MGFIEFFPTHSQPSQLSQLHREVLNFCPRILGSSDSAVADKLPLTAQIIYHHLICGGKQVTSFKQSYLSIKFIFSSVVVQVQVKRRRGHSWRAHWQELESRHNWSTATQKKGFHYVPYEALGEYGLIKIQFGSIFQQPSNQSIIYCLEAVTIMTY